MKMLVIPLSIIADVLDLTVVGHFLYPLDILVIVVHLIYGGPRALIGILDMIPGVGLLPIYSILAFTYPERRAHA